MPLAGGDGLIMRSRNQQPMVNNAHIRRNKSGPVRTSMENGTWQIYGSLIQDRVALWDHRDVTGPAMKVGAVQGSDDLETIRNAVNGWSVGVVALGQAGYPGLAALGALQSFVPFIGHGPG
jgi:hypothetical protein